ncbi:MAG: hypothetical protein IPL76_07100 [Gemmatimonadetes bacterium]|nr:hypothetical protein [Gemmatimonadota bacterium]
MTPSDQTSAADPWASLPAGTDPLDGLVHLSNLLGGRPGWSSRRQHLHQDEGPGP